MFLHLSRYDLLTTLAALQQARAYRRHSKRYVRKDSPLARPARRWLRVGLLMLILLRPATPNWLSAS